VTRLRSAFPWLLPTGTSLLTAALGVIVNIATGANGNWLAWSAVGCLALLVAWGTALSERRHAPASGGTGARIEASGSATTETYGLVARRTVTTSLDGSRTEMIEFYSENVALKAFRESDD
jgi:hypothetical protein